jgi:putative hydrolase of the HAD superfamily
VPPAPALPIRAITFDLDETLWPVWPTIVRAEKALYEWISTHAPSTARRYTIEGLRQVRDEVARIRLDLAHDVAELRRVSTMAALERAGDDPELVHGAWEAFMRERQRVEPFPDALPALETLARRFPLATITNGNADVNLIGIGHLFRANFMAGVEGIAKPDPRIFHRAADALGVAPGAVLHVGDDTALDVIAGRAAGMHVAWINRGGHAWDHDVPAPELAFTDLAELVRWLDATQPGPRHD